MALVTSGAAFGGLERQILHLVAHLRESDGAAPAVYLQHDHTLASHLRAAGVTPRILGVRRLAGARRLRRALAEDPVDVIHAHDRPATLLAALARPRDAALVRTIHSLPTRRAVPSLNAARWALSSWAERALLETRCDVICFPSADLYARLHLDRARGLRRVIPNGVPAVAPSSPTRPADLPTAGAVVGVIGRLSREKGVDLGLSALAHPDAPPDLHLVVLGRGDLRCALEAEARALGVAERVHMLGFRDDLAPYLAHLDAVLLPSRHEGLPFAALEAMAAGCPVIAARVGGLPELIDDGHTGLLVPPEDPAALARGLSRLLGSPALRERLTAAARAHVTARFTRTAMGEAHRTLYRDAVARRRGGHAARDPGRS